MTVKKSCKYDEYGGLGLFLVFHMMFMSLRRHVVAVLCFLYLFCILFVSPFSYLGHSAFDCASVGCEHWTFLYRGGISLIERTGLTKGRAAGVPKTSISPDFKRPTFNPAVYGGSSSNYQVEKTPRQTPVRHSRKSLREIKPHLEESVCHSKASEVSQCLQHRAVLELISHKWNMLQ